MHLIAITSAILGLSTYSISAEKVPIKSIYRFALIVAANDGGRDRAQLRYAETDATAFSDVLKSIGNVREKDALRLNQPTPQVLRNTFSELVPKLQAAQSDARRLELIVYYSGHSDSEGLLLGEDKFTYQELKAELSKVPADVRIAVLDACSSGAMTRQKGGVLRPPFTVDESNRVHGYAVLTSSSENEAAQESDRIKASFFTHYLISGMRGGGDLNGDGRVTLNEAYNFAFHETLSRTQDTLGGPQHPAYDIQLVGSGDVVMTDLQATNASVSLDKEVYGRFFIRNHAGNLAVELRKVAGRIIELGLESGEYGILMEQDGFMYEGEIDLKEGTRTALDLNTFGLVDSEKTVLRGDPRGQPLRRRIVPVDVGLVPALSLNGGNQHASLNYFSINLALGYAYALEGWAMAFGGHWLVDSLIGVQSTLVFNYAGNSGRGAQLTLGFNGVDGAFDGVQSSLLANRVGRNLRGI